MKRARTDNVFNAPRGQTKEIQKLKAAIEMMNFKEEENWKVNALVSAPEDDQNLGVKKLYGDEIMMMDSKTYV